MSPRAQRAAFHAALQGVLDEYRPGALLTRFVITLEVSEGEDGGQALMHRSGDLDGGAVSAWLGYGMAGATFEDWRVMLLDATRPAGGEDGDGS